MKNILVVNVNWVGDVIFSTPVFKAIRKTYPQAKITCFAVPRVKEVLESCPYIDQIILCDEDGKRHGWIAQLRLLFRLRQERFDIAFLLHRSWSRAFLVFLAGVPIRVGYATKNRGKLLTHKVEPLEGAVHRSDHYLNVVESYGIKVHDRTCELAVSPAAKQEVQGLLRRAGILPGEKFIVVNTGANWDLKRWPKKNFSLLIQRLIREGTGKVVIPGAPSDVTLASQIAQDSGVNPAILAGKTNLKQLMALMSMSRLVISADSGPMHVANCLGTPLVVIFGPTRPEITAPRGKGRFILLQKDVGCNQESCYRLDCPDNVCMQAVTVDDVYAAAQQLLA